MRRLYVSNAQSEGAACSLGILAAKPMKRHVVFTAPHTVRLYRDGMDPHLPEDYTGTLVRMFAESTGGTWITWHKRERDRVFSLPDHGPSATNRDPNYLRNDDLDTSEWFHALKFVRDGFSSPWTESGSYIDTLHVDVHGMHDPDPTSRSTLDCEIGTTRCADVVECTSRRIFKARQEPDRPLREDPPRWWG